MNNLTQFWDLSKPKMARDFLMNLHLGGSRVTGVELADGTWLEFKDATDEQIMDFAQQIAEMIGERPRGPRPA